MDNVQFQNQAQPSSAVTVDSSMGGAFSQPQASVPPVNPMGSAPTSGMPVMASFFERLLAVIIDGVIIMIFSFIIGLVLGLLLIPFSGTSLEFTKFSGNSSTSTLSNWLSIAISFIYAGYFLTKKGATPGKQAMKIRVVKVEGFRNITWLEAFLREVLGKVLSGLVILLGYIWYFFDDKKQTWHDKIAGTYVVKTDGNGKILMQ